MGFFDKLKFSRLREGLARSRDAFMENVQKLLRGKTRIDDEVIENLEEVFLAADVGVATSTELIERIRERVRKDGYDSPDVLNTLVRDEVRKLFNNGQEAIDDPFAALLPEKPYVIMIVGVNGVGKTTTIGKLAYGYRSRGKQVIVAAADTFRAAANEQLEIWADRAGVEIIRAGAGAQHADPAAVAYDALIAAASRGTDVMIIDTAGRLHTKVNLMEELKKIKRVLQKLRPAAPHEVLLVLDASIGQNAIQQAKQFGNAVGITGLVLTKLDGTAKGGIVLAISRELSIPVKYVGVGEKIDDLQPFDGKAFVDALFSNQ